MNNHLLQKRARQLLNARKKRPLLGNMYIGVVYIFCITWLPFLLKSFNAPTVHAMIDPTAVAPSATPTPTTAPLKTQIVNEIRYVFREHADAAIAVAKCESSLNDKIKSPKSSARGLFQIILGTWEDYNCEGSRLNFKDNIACAKKIFDRNGQRFNTTGGWAASYSCHKQP